MKKGIILDQAPSRVVDLGTGYSNVYLNVVSVVGTEPDELGESISVDKYKADVIKVANPATEGNILRQAISQLIAEISGNDKSDNVNSFFVEGKKMWVPRDLRTVLKMRIEAEKGAGKDETTLWFGENCYTFRIDVVLTMLQRLELYAAECYDVTAKHKQRVGRCNSVEDVLAYSYKNGYPDKLRF